MPQLLLELFSEEIPARMQQGGARDLERMVTDRLKAAGLTYDALTAFAGPRRLTLVVEGLPAATPDREEELKGPRANAPEQALEGFLRKTGLTRDQLVERDGVLFAVISSKGRPTAALIPDMIDQIVRNFPWPKSMRWGSGTLRWVRPLKRIVALFDGHVVPFEIDGIASGDVTEGHRFLGSGQPFAVKDFADYRKKLEAEHVLLDVADRKLRILEAAQKVCHDKGLALVDDDGLLDEVAGLAEWPTPILGDMDSQFLDLPPEVVRLSMKVHQKYFAVRDPATHGLAPHFVVVANVEASDGGKALAAGNSRVLSARLDDARFFWDEDLKTGFDAWNDKLKGVTFHAKLGTLAERVDRISALVREIAPLVGADPDQAEQAARLSKADLASAMVGEFPELQGVMGGYYVTELLPSPLMGEGPGLGVTAAAASSAPSDASADTPIPTLPPSRGKGSELADAVRDHYKPQGPADTVPTAPLTVAVALADKLDTLVGFFAIDEKPTGSKDPFALRRAALGVIRLVLENELSSGLRALVVSWIINEVARERDQYDLDLQLESIADSLPDPSEDLSSMRDLIASNTHRLVFVGHSELEEWEKVVMASIEGRASDEDIDGAERALRDIIRGIGAATDAFRELPDEIAALVSDEQRAQRKADSSIWLSSRTQPFQNEVLAFFADRLKVLLRDQGKRHDLVDAVFALGDDDLVRIVRRVEALDAFLATDDGANLLAGYKRASNILRAEEKKAPLPAGEPVALTGAPTEETALIAAAASAATAVDAALETEDFAAAMKALAALRAPVDAFFTAVLVNSDVLAERDNRLKLLGQVRAVMGRVADFGQIAG